MCESAFNLDDNRQQRMLGRIDEILASTCGLHGLHSRQDVLFLAIDALWRQTTTSGCALCGGGQKRKVASPLPVGTTAASRQVDAETKIEGQESSEQSKKEEAMNHRYIDISKLHRRVWIIMMTVVIIDLLAAFA